MNKNITFIVMLITATIFTCARVSSPMGGPEDETPPKLVNSIPEQGQTNFSGQTVILTFDEWVTTKSIETDIIITPRIQGSFRTRVKKNVVELSFFEPLQENTTYAMGFGSTIEDITNQNSAENLNLSFSTGPYIDSLTISGNIKLLLDQEPAEDALVSLYSESDTTDILNGVASYFALTDSLGDYKFNNLPPGAYRIYATNDKNGNNKADSKSEKYGFYPDTLQLVQNITDINFTIQNLNATELRELSSRHFGHYFDITFNKEITDFNILTDVEYEYRRESEDKIRFYRNRKNLNDTVQVIYSALDSLGNNYQDTVGVYFTETKIDKDDFTVNSAPNQPSVFPYDTLKFLFNKPIIGYNLDSISIYLDSATSVNLNPEAFRFNKYKTELNTGLAFYDYLTSTTSQLSIQLKQRAFISADLDSSESFEKKYNFIEQSETATITGKVITDSSNIIVQLLNANNRKVLREVFVKDYRFEYLPAGRYMVRVIDDTNGNRKLDIGNILTNEVPEDIHYFFDTYYQTKVIEVRKNWENSNTNITF